MPKPKSSRKVGRPRAAREKPSRVELDAAMHAFEAGARAPRTLKEYKRDWLQFCAFCDDEGINALPAEARSVARYATFMAHRGLKASSIKRALAAISQVHKSRDVPSPTSAAVVTTVLSGIQRELGTRPTKKKAILVDDLRRIVEKLPKSLPGLRDRALMVIGFAGAFRRSELVALNVADVIFSKHGLKITIRRSKTDQVAAGQFIGIAPGKHEATCAVRALRAWLDASGIRRGPIFVSVTRTGKLGPRLRDRDVARIVQRAVRAAGYDPALFAGHSLRRGLITAAVRAGRNERDIMKQSRHRSRASLNEYIEENSVFTDNATDGLGL